MAAIPESSDALKPPSLLPSSSIRSDLAPWLLLLLAIVPEFVPLLADRCPRIDDVVDDAVETLATDGTRMDEPDELRFPAPLPFPRLRESELERDVAVKGVVGASLASTEGRENG
jgi:hypothetical protein